MKTGNHGRDFDVRPSPEYRNKCFGRRRARPEGLSQNHTKQRGVYGLLLMVTSMLLLSHKGGRLILQVVNASWLRGLPSIVSQRHVKEVLRWRRRRFVPRGCWRGSAELPRNRAALEMTV